MNGMVERFARSHVKGGSAPGGGLARATGAVLLAVLAMAAVMPGAQAEDAASSWQPEVTAAGSHLEARAARPPVMPPAIKPRLLNAQRTTEVATAATEKPAAVPAAEPKAPAPAAPAAATAAPAPVPEKAPVSAAAPPAAAPAAEALPGPLEPARAVTPGSIAATYCNVVVDQAVAAKLAEEKRTAKALQAEIETALAALDKATAEHERWLKLRNEFKEKAQENVVRVYSGMAAEAAAQRLSVVSEEVAAAILSKLPPKVASVILGEIEPQRAARLTNYMAGAAEMTPPAGSKAAAAAEASTP